jgi:hypothetical protein
MIRYRQILLASGIGLLMAGPVQAQQRGELMRDTLSNLGLLEKEQPAINYHERPPLVMPPKLDGKALPAPRARTASPQWPKEPEVVQRERDDAERRLPRGSQIQGRYNDNNATASIDEMRSGRRADAQIPTAPERKPGDNNRDSFWVNPLELMRGIGEEKAEPSVVEPTRDTLTQPPTGYRKAPRKVVTTNSDPINNASREREEADPGAYIRSRGR